ncbi:zinc ribbon domain-containing protein [Aureivirga sp. CE67]|uniref:zinc ribbon domain-containing protein n=1 Tax=Aureivirga sp. CE67 TaxID=1788983 RepID=UPI0018CA37AB|nr:zinc ribbon domain-containing protein [Aureivirga sp. CE67]
MNCSRCNTQNEKEAKFCHNCGIDLKLNPSQKPKQSDIILLFYICFEFLLFLIQKVVQMLNESWYNSSARYVMYTLWIFSSLSMILIPLSIKNKVFKYVGLVMVLIMSLYWSYNNILELFKPLHEY